MGNQNLIIYKFNLLYQVLQELDLNFKFKIFFVESEDILNDLVKATKPRYMKLTAKFYVRGGIFTNVVVDYRKKAWKPQPKVDLDVFPSQNSVV